MPSICFSIASASSAVSLAPSPIGKRAPLGVRPPLASWGTLIYDGYAYLSDSKIPVIVASAALAIATLGFTLFGEALRDAVDPRLDRGGH